LEDKQKWQWKSFNLRIEKEKKQDLEISRYQQHPLIYPYHFIFDTLIEGQDNHKPMNPVC